MIPERILKLREQYMSCPMMTDKSLSYNLCKRQSYLFMKGWQQNGEATTVLRKAKAYSHVLLNMRPVISDNELIVGQPDYGDLEPHEADEWEILRKHQNLLPKDGGRRDHKSLDFEKLINKGVEGILSEIAVEKSKLDLNRAEDIEKSVFYAASEKELYALLNLAERYVKHAEELAEKADAKQKSELEKIAEILRKVPLKPASTFREALQSMHFYSFHLWGLYQCGHPDRYLLPFYENDLKSGTLTKEAAQELIDCFCLMYTTYVNSDSSIGFMVGGRYPDGTLVENELTWMFLKSIEHTRTADPSIGFCVNSDTGEEILRYIAGLLSKGYSHPAIYNDDCITKSLISYGVPKHDAHSYIHSCCVEITIDKKSDVFVVSPYHNTLQYLLDVLKTNEDAKDLNEIIELFSTHLHKKIVEENYKQNLYQLERSKNSMEPHLVSCLTDDCIKRGKGIYNGGAVYNWTQPNFVGISNTVESLLTVDTLIFSDKELTLKELNSILDKNYEGHEELLGKINKTIPHFGVSDKKADGLYKQITDIIKKSCEGILNYRGDILIPAAFSYNEHVKIGKNTPASPDGRRSGEPLNDGSNPVQGKDCKGPTSMIGSVTHWNQSQFLGGIATNLKIQKNTDAEILLALIRTFLQNGGVELQISATSNEELKDAVLNPEKHKDLLVRVGGYSDYFVTLPKELQQEIISRTEQQ